MAQAGFSIAEDGTVATTVILDTGEVAFLCNEAIRLGLVSAPTAAPVPASETVADGAGSAPDASIPSDGSADSPSPGSAPQGATAPAESVPPSQAQATDVGQPDPSPAAPVDS